MSQTTPATIAGNRRIARALQEVADLLEDQGANPFRVTAYRRAADTVHHLDQEIGELFAREGFAGLTALPSVGHGIAGAIREMLVTGHWGQLERLRGTHDPVRVFRRIPGIGPRLAESIHRKLDIDSLEALEIAAYDGRLESVPGMGPRRTALVRAALASMGGRRPALPHANEPRNEPDVETLLIVDGEYRDKAAQGKLPRIAPRRFNPERQAWLPVFHTQKGRWNFTALFSNTARAHELGKTGDWVVIYFYDDHHREARSTVVTETHGALAGQRVVRGREAECHAFHNRRRSFAAA
jgi:putative hydrolase